MNPEINDLLAKAQDGKAIANLANAFHIAPEQAKAVTENLTQALGFKIFQNSLSPTRLADVVSLLGDPQARQALKEPSALTSAATINAGNGILDVLVGDKHRSRGIANKASSATGVDAETIKKMLPVVASMLIGATQSKAQTVLPQALKGVPDIGDLLPMPGGGGQPRNIPNTSGNDDWTDSSVRKPLPQTQSGGQGGGVLLPLPGDRPGRSARPRTGYDDIGDILRRGGGSGGGQVELPQGGGGIDNLIRSILGGLFGYRPKGVVGSMIYMMVMRWLMSNGWRILSRILLGRR